MVRHCPFDHILGKFYIRYTFANIPCSMMLYFVINAFSGAEVFDFETELFNVFFYGI